VNKLASFFLPVFAAAMLTAAAPQAKADGTNPSTGAALTMTVNPYASGENNGSFYVGLTSVNLNGSGYIGTFQAFCDDFTHEITPPATYGVTVQAITSDVMKQEAYYGMMFGAQASGNTAYDSALQELIWNYTAPNKYAMTSEMSTLQAQMLANYASVDYSNSFYLNAGNNGQSFMVTQPVSVAPTPEPSSLITLGTGMLGMAGLIRRKMSRKVA